MNTGRRIAFYRQRKKLKQSELAAKVGISRISMSNYERGSRVPTIDVATRIAVALNVSLDELFGEKTNVVIKKDTDEITNENDMNLKSAVDFWKLQEMRRQTELLKKIAASLEKNKN